MFDFSSEEKSFLASGFFWFIPYALVSWGYVEVSGGGAKDFWSAFGVLLAASLFFNFLDFLGSVIAWQMYLKKLTVRKLLAFLRDNNFPQRQNPEDDFEDYLYRIANPLEDDLDDDGSEDQPSAQPAYSERLVMATQALRSDLHRTETSFLAFMRYRAAGNAALDIFSPNQNKNLMEWK